MAKRVTALKCPQCGSVKKQSIKEDHYICNHCDTEYFLDNDDINVNINHHHKRTSWGSTKELNPTTIGVGIGAVLTLIFFGFSEFLSNSTVRPQAKEDNYSQYAREQILYNGSDGSPKILLTVDRRYVGQGNRKSEYLFLFYDPIAERTINTQKAPAQWGDNPTLYLRKFSDGVVYFIADKMNQVYKLDTLQNQMVEISGDLFSSKPKLASGVATVKFANDIYGDGFKIMTNDGKDFSYYPIADLIYADDKKFFEDAEQLHTLPAGAKDKNYYIFSRKSSSYPDEPPVQLIKYAYKEKPGYPIRLPYNAEWDDISDYDKGPFAKKKSLFRYSDHRISSYKDLTPGRAYFNPDIMYQEENRLYISALPNANPNNSRQIQKIDTETGSVIWTYKPGSTQSNINDLTVANGMVGFHYSGSQSERFYKYLLLNDKDGTLIKEIDLDNFRLK